MTSSTKKTNRTKNDVPRPADMMRDMAQQMAQLAERLHDDGTIPLNSFDKQLMRIAYMPALKENYELAVAMFMGGTPDAYHLERMIDIFRYFNHEVS